MRQDGNPGIPSWSRSSPRWCPPADLDHRAGGMKCARESRRAKREVCSPPAVACGSVAAGIAQFVQQLFCRDQIAGTETLREAVVDRLETGDGIGRTALIS